MQNQSTPANPGTALPASLLWIPKSSVSALLKYYDYPHPHNPEEIIEGYDKAHALRTAKMSATVAHYLHHDTERVRLYQIACLLHDLGRAGLEQALFGKIWSWANANNIPTRPGEWRNCHPETTYGQETEAFWDIYKTELEAAGIPINDWTKEQIEMRLGYARRLHRQLEQIIPTLQQHNIQWSEWMEKVLLYYYYPEKLENDPDWVHELGEILVACEQLEAYSNRERGNDYYNRSSENFEAAFAYLDSLKEKGQLGEKVLSAVRYLTSQGLFDTILAAARQRKLTKPELDFLHSL